MLIDRAWKDLPIKALEIILEFFVLNLNADLLT